MSRHFRAFAVVPAAGRSRRMIASRQAASTVDLPTDPQGSKLLLPWGNATVIERVLAAWIGSGVQRVFVVIRPDDRSLRRVVQRLPVELVCPVPSPAEMKDSVRAALRVIARDHQPSREDVFLVAPADLPQLSSSQINRLLRAHCPACPSILVPTGPGGRGHPVLFPWSLAEQIDRLAPEQGLNRLLERFPVRSIPVDQDFGREDVDTWEDYQRLRPFPLDGPLPE